MKNSVFKDLNHLNQKLKQGNISNINLLSWFDKMSSKQIFENPEMSSDRNLYLESLFYNTDYEKSCKEVK